MTCQEVDYKINQKWDFWHSLCFSRNLKLPMKKFLSVKNCKKFFKKFWYFHSKSANRCFSNKFSKKKFLDPRVPLGRIFIKRPLVQIPRIYLLKCNVTNIQVSAHFILIVPVGGRRPSARELSCRSLRAPLAWAISPTLATRPQWAPTWPRSTMGSWKKLFCYS